MNKEENIELAKQLLEKAESYSEAEEEYSDEAMWNDLKLKARAFIKADSLCVTEEDTDRLKKRIDVFSKYGPAMVKACTERYKRDVLEQDVKVRQAHEINEAAKLYVTDPNAAAAAISGIASLFGTPAPKITVQPKKVIETSNDEVVADVTLSED